MIRDKYDISCDVFQLIEPVKTAGDTKAQHDLKDSTDKQCDSGHKLKDGQKLDQPKPKSTKRAHHKKGKRVRRGGATKSQKDDA